MREVPFGRARVFHRLDRHVLRRERACQVLREVARVEQAVFENALAVDSGALDRELPRHARLLRLKAPAAPDGERPGSVTTPATSQCARLLLVPCAPNKAGFTFFNGIAQTSTALRKPS